MKVSIVIVNYNGKHLLERCLASLSNITFSSVEIIIVDNNSNDNSVLWITKTYPKIKVVRLSKNEGFAKANNVGVYHTKGKYILFLNNDTEVTKDFLEPLVKSLDSDSHLGGVQSKILLLKDKKRLDSVGAYFTNTGFLFHFGYNQIDSKKYNKEFYLYTAKGACMLFRKHIIDEVGLFDENFFAYFEETDFCHRVWLAGYTIKYQPKSVIYHLMGATANTLKNDLVQYHSFKNRICSYIKNLEKQTLFKILPKHISLCVIASIGFALRGKIGLGVSIFRAMLWNILNIKKTLKQREEVQKVFRVIKDNDFLYMVEKNPPFRYYFYLFVFSLQGYIEK